MSTAWQQGSGTPSENEVERIVAAAVAGHRMAGMEPTAEDVAALRRVLAGQSTPEEESERILREIAAARS